MGGPKALLLVSGVPLLLLHLRRLAEAGCERICVVVRPEVQGGVEAMLRDAPEAALVRLVAAHTDSQAESLAHAARALLREQVQPQAPVVVTPLDLLPPSLSTLRALLSAAGGDGLAATPVHRGRGGHPIVLRAALLHPYVTEALPPVLRVLLERVGPRRVRVEVDDASVLGDLDSPADFHVVLGSEPSFLGGAGPS